MSFKFFLMYEVVRLVVCQRFYKKNFKIIPRKCKRPFFEKRNCDFLNYRDMIFFFFFFEREFQPMASAPDDSSLSTDQDTNQFLV